MRVPEFNATCTYSHSVKDDPIVFPGLPGASHMHSFFGNRSTNAGSTLDSLRANTTTTCTPAPADLSAYWVPTLYDRGTAVEPKESWFTTARGWPTRAARCRSRSASR
ncbi:DUF1996 domain-containing protein [Catellatospora coxensis]